MSNRATRRAAAAAPAKPAQKPAPKRPAKGAPKVAPAAAAAMPDQHQKTLDALAGVILQDLGVAGVVNKAISILGVQAMTPEVMDLVNYLKAQAINQPPPQPPAA